MRPAQVVCLGLDCRPVKAIRDSAEIREEYATMQRWKAYPRMLSCDVADLCTATVAAVSMSSASVPAISMPEGDIPVAAASSSKDDESLSTIPPAKPQSYMQQALGLFRASCVFGILLGATATNVTVAMLIHAVTRDRKKAQGRCVYSICMITSWALKFIPWITIKMKLPPQPIDFEQFLLTSNHISFMDLFFIQHTMYHSLSRQAIQRVRLIYWEKLASIPLVKGIFTLTGGVPIKILGSTSLKEGDNKYCKDSVKAVYGAVDKAIVEDKLSIALSFEGRRNPNPPTLSKIQRGMFKMHQQYKIPVVLIRLRGVEKIWAAEGLPTGTGVVECTMLPHAYMWPTAEAYEEGLRAVYERGEDGPPPSPLASSPPVTGAMANVVGMLEREAVRVLEGGRKGEREGDLAITPVE
ncbi:hypothetical protein VYU27_006402 [Nannochloropsis oceanica]